MGGGGGGEDMRSRPHLYAHHPSSSLPFPSTIASRSASMGGWIRCVRHSHSHSSSAPCFRLTGWQLTSTRRLRPSTILYYSGTQAQWSFWSMGMPSPADCLRIGSQKPVARLVWYLDLLSWTPKLRYYVLLNDLLIEKEKDLVGFNLSLRWLHPGHELFSLFFFFERERENSRCLMLLGDNGLEALFTKPVFPGQQNSSWQFKPRKLQQSSNWQFKPRKLLTRASQA